MSMTDSRRSVGITDPLDTFLEKQHSLPARLHMALSVDTNVGRIEELILGANSSDPQTALLNRLNLHLTMNGAGKKVGKGTHRAVLNILRNLKEQSGDAPLVFGMSDVEEEDE